jgi:hypothetical protein
MSGVLLAAQAHAQCSKDIDCKGERVCEAGQCVDPKPMEPLPPPPPPAAAPAEGAPAAAPPSAAVPSTAPQPAAPLPPPIVADEAASAQPMHRRSPAIMTTGIVLTSAAVPLMLIAGALSNRAYDSCVKDQYTTSSSSPSSFYDSNPCRDARDTRGTAIIIGGIIGLGVGIPMIIYGAKKVPASGATATLTPWATPTAGGATLRLTL